MLIDRVIIDKLIFIGRSLPTIRPPATDSILGLKPRNLTFRKESWLRSISGLSLNELTALLKGLVLVLDLEKLHPQLHRPSAIQIRWIFHYIQDQDFRFNSNLDLSMKLADQLLSSTDRCDVPLGSESNFGAKSYKELVRNRVAFRRQCEYTSDMLKERKIIAGINRSTRGKQSKNTALYRGTPVQKKHIEKLRALTVGEKLTFIANDDKYSVGFYPGNIAHQATSEVIAGLDDNTKLMILAKLKGKRKGPWGRLKKRLLDSFRRSERDYYSTPWD
jgi:hypothetical protein